MWRCWPLQDHISHQNYTVHKKIYCILATSKHKDQVFLDKLYTHIARGRFMNIPKNISFNNIQVCIFTSNPKWEVSTTLSTQEIQWICGDAADKSTWWKVMFGIILLQHISLYNWKAISTNPCYISSHQYYLMTSNKIKNPYLLTKRLRSYWRPHHSSQTLYTMLAVLFLA